MSTAFFMKLGTSARGDGGLNLRIQIQSFEGPLPLLLHLIKREDMDIFDINIHEITRQYLDYIRAMKQFDLGMAGEFIAMAATLIHIKSRMLLPQYNEGEEVEEELDPRRELVHRLLEYQKFQEASGQLYMRSLVGRDVWVRGVRLVFEDSKEGEPIVLGEDNALFALMSAYRRALKNMKKDVHRISSDMLSIGERILEIRGLLDVGELTPFSRLLGGPALSSASSVNQVLVTFLSMLELAKMGFVSLFQSGNFQEIYVRTHRIIDGRAVEVIEDYDLVEGTWETALNGTLENALSGTLEKTFVKGDLLGDAIVDPSTEVVAATDEDLIQEELLLNLEGGV